MQNQFASIYRLRYNSSPTNSSRDSSSPKNSSLDSSSPETVLPLKQFFPRQFFPGTVLPQTVHTLKIHFFIYELSGEELSRGRTVSGEELSLGKNCLWGRTVWGRTVSGEELSQGKNCPGKNWSGEELFWGRNVWGRTVRGRTFWGRTVLHPIFKGCKNQKFLNDFGRKRKKTRKNAKILHCDFSGLGRCNFNSKAVGQQDGLQVYSKPDNLVHMFIRGRQIEIIFELEPADSNNLIHYTQRSIDQSQSLVALKLS